MTILSGNTAAGLNVFKVRGDYDKSRANLPYISMSVAIATNPEVSAGGAMGMEAQVSLELMEDGDTLAAAGVALDALEVEVFTLLASNQVLTGSIAEQYAGTDEPENDTDSERPTARQVMSYVILYRTPRDGSHETVV